MRGEAPRFRRCCFCIPLRRGILGWGYLKLALNLLAIIVLTFLYIITWPHGVSSTDVISLLVGAIYRIVDVTFSVLLIVACHKKSPKLLKIYYMYGIVELILIMASTSIITYSEIEEAIKTWASGSQELFGSVVISMVTTIATYFLDIFMCLYVFFLVRSEYIKLREQNLEMQFVNNAADGEARCVCTDYNNDNSAKDTNNAQDPSVQYTDDGHDSSVQYTDDGDDTDKGGAKYTVHCQTKHSV